jgi:hypothetical protein
LSYTRRAAGVAADIAFELCERLPELLEALREGLVDLARARVIIDRTDHLDVEAARRITAKILQGLEARTTGQIRASLRRLVINRFPEQETVRYRQGVEQRHVSLSANAAGPPTCPPTTFPPTVLKQR